MSKLDPEKKPHKQKPTFLPSHSIIKLDIEYFGNVAEIFSRSQRLRTRIYQHRKQNPLKQPNNTRICLQSTSVTPGHIRGMALCTVFGLFVYPIIGDVTGIDIPIMTSWWDVGSCDGMKGLQCEQNLMPREARLNLRIYWNMYMLRFSRMRHEKFGVIGGLVIC